jgi:hypothetical protein
MSFQTEIYPYRNNRQELPRRLLTKVDQEFTEIVPVSGYPIPRRNIGGKRCRFKLNIGNEVCEYSATLQDKSIVKLLLKAWLRQISDRYLDFADIQMLERASNRLNGPEEYFKIIRNNSTDGGAVRFIYNELPNNIYLFGSLINIKTTYNQYFSEMIAWDQIHFTGLLNHVNTFVEQRSGGGNLISISHVFQAAMLYIVRDKKNNPKSIYNELTK